MDKCQIQRPLKISSSLVRRGYDRIRTREFEDVSKHLFSAQGQPPSLQILQQPAAIDSALDAHKHAPTDTRSTLPYDEDLTKIDTSDKLSVGHDPSSSTWTFVEVVDADQLNTVLPHNKRRLMIRLQQEHSFARLSITEALYNSLCAELQIFDALRDVLMHFGVRAREVEIAPQRMRWQTLKDSSSSKDEAHRGWECAYCLRYLQPNHRSSGQPWSLRQFTVYNKVQLSDVRSTWLFVSAPEDVVGGINSTLPEKEYDICLTDVETHCSISMTTMAFWRSYVVYLSKVVEEYTGKVSFANPAGCHIIDVAKEGMLVQLKHIDDDIVDAVLALEVNIDQMKSLLMMWKRCGVHVGTKDDSSSVTPTMHEVMLDVEAILRQLRSLRDKVATCTFLASRFAELGSGTSLKENGEDLCK
ncbi:hypothetical protein LTR64_003374 [Lithohypha guttulata]|uniref:uncharacterized protein n=1 Tax=Lithohypha guttulata TaxID=1690604 RepID=UPI002DE13A02|nr:hypothetical protein LTR51_000407 [Lithohypha guttulata]